MQINNYHILGVMSGTSLDGVDLAEIKFTNENNNWFYSILSAETISYPTNWVEKLKDGINLPNNELESLNIEYTEYLGKLIKKFIEDNNLQDLDAVCSHGHTILHQPHHGFTLQIGNLPEIAQYSQNIVVCDFRVQDVQLSGQGAPLVPIGDHLLFSKYDFCLNLGGFSNISFQENGKRIAFDISPVNTVLNYLANQISKEYDDRGISSSNGTINPNLFDELNDLNFYHEHYPKSLGFEFVKGTILPLISKYNDTIENLLRTFTEHIAYQTAKILLNKTGKMLVTGGGAFNDFLILRMQQLLPEIEIIIPDSKTINFKEALIFGFLGVLKLRNEINVLASVTGAKHDHSSGKVFKP